MRATIRERLAARVGSSSAGAAEPADAAPAERSAEGVAAAPAPAAAPKATPRAAAAAPRSAAKRAAGAGEGSSKSKGGAGGRDLPRGGRAAATPASAAREGRRSIKKSLERAGISGAKGRAREDAGVAGPGAGGVGGQERQPFLVMTVDIGQGRSDKIEVREGDEPEALAAEFVRNNQLSDRIIRPLASHIEENVARVNSERSAGASQAASARKKHLSAARRPASAAPKAARKPQPSPRPQSARKLQDPEIFNRLHNQAKITERKREAKRRQQEEAELRAMHEGRTGISWASKQMMHGRNAGEYDNYGERLYVEGRIHLERKKVLAEKYNREKERSEVDGVTFKPQISRMSQEIVRRSTHAQLHLDPSAALRQRRIEAMRKEKEAREMDECTFQPKINRKSEVLMTERTQALESYHISAHEQLYQDAEQRRLRKARYSQYRPPEETFRPATNASSVQRQVSFADSEGIVDRLYKKKAQADVVKRQEKEIYENYDATTGQRLFKPATGRGPVFERNRGGLPIGDYLYSMRYEFDDKKEYISELDKQKMKEDMNMLHITDKSDRIINKLKRRRFKQIFQYLDRSKTGVITLADVDLDRLDAEVKRDITHAARFAGAEELDLEGFSLRMDQGIMAHPGPRRYLQPTSRAKEPEKDDNPYQPRLNRKSQAIASRRRQGMSFQEALAKEQEAARAHLEQLKREAEEREMEGCTFHPRLNNPGEVLSAKAPGGSPSMQKALAKKRLTDTARYEGEQRFKAIEAELQAVLDSSPESFVQAPGSAGSGSVSPQLRDDADSHFNMLRTGATLYALESNLQAMGAEGGPASQEKTPQQGASTS